MKRAIQDERRRFEQRHGSIRIFINDGYRGCESCHRINVSTAYDFQIRFPRTLFGILIRFEGSGVPTETPTRPSQRFRLSTLQCMVKGSMIFLTLRELASLND